MPGLSTVDLVFRDLEDALGELLAQTTSPKQIRRSFGRFIDLSQKLTATMYKEYRARTGENWAASGFGGWNDVTDLFKELRRIDQHEPPVLIQVHETRYYRIGEGTPNLLAFAGTWELSLEHQQANEPPDGIRLSPPDPETGGPSSQEFRPVRIDYEFHLHPSTSKLEVLLTRIGDHDVRRLSRKCFEVLTEYYRYYQRQLVQANETQSPSTQPPG